jgi:UPF0716 protein FxsA
MSQDRQQMTVIKWLLLTMLMLPFLELAAFIAVTAIIGFGWALILLLTTSLVGLMVLRRAGDNHIARVRVALARDGLTSLQADGAGGLILLGGFLLLIPGFITDIMGFMLLLAPLWAPHLTPFISQGTKRHRHGEGVVDLEPEQWRHVPDPELPNGRNDKHKNG